MVPAFVFYGVIVATLGSPVAFHSGVAVYPEPVKGSHYVHRHLVAHLQSSIQRVLLIYKLVFSNLPS
jgi:hypothetical protein